MRRLLLLIALAALLAACSGPSAPATEVPAVEPAGVTASADATQLDVCTLFTAQDAARALPSEAQGVATSSHPIYTCYYETGNYETLTITVVIYDDAETARISYETTVDYGGYEDVRGVGDMAYSAAPALDLVAYYGQYEISVDFTDGSEPSAQLANAIDVANVVISHLP